jgi:hypothetical protein
MIDDREGMLRSTADGVDTIKRFMLRDSNFVSHLSGAFLATQMVRDLILIGAVPVRVDYIDGWWSISAERDWLVQTDGAPSLWNFYNIVHFPQVGREACRSEILLTAFADVLVTRGAEGELIWISGDKNQWRLPEEINDSLSRPQIGRIVLFKRDEDRAAPQMAMAT